MLVGDRIIGASYNELEWKSLFEEKYFRRKMFLSLKQCVLINGDVYIIIYYINVLIRNDMLIKKIMRSVTMLGILMLQGSLFAAASSASSSFQAEDVQALMMLGDIKDVAVLRAALKRCSNDPAWQFFNMCDSDWHPAEIARENRFHASALLLSHFHRTDNPLFHAVMFGDRCKVDAIVAKKPARVHEFLFDLKSPLVWAILLEDKKMVRCFLDKGARIDASGCDLMTPWFHAQFVPGMQKIMMPFGGYKLNAQQDLFGTDIVKMHAALQQYPDLLMKPLQSHLTPLRYAVQHNNYAVTNYLGHRGALGNDEAYARDVFGDACVSENIDIMILLARQRVNGVRVIDLALQQRDDNFSMQYDLLSDKVKAEIISLSVCYTS